MRRRTTIMILAPGRNAIHLEVPVLPPLQAAAALLLVPLCLGVTAQRFLGDIRTSRSYPALAMGSLHRVDRPAVRRIHRDPQPLRAATKATTLPVASHVTVRPPAGPPLPPEQPSFGQNTLRALMTAVRPPDQPQMQTASLVPQLSTTAQNGRFSGLSAGDVISVKSILKAISLRRRSIAEAETNQVPINGVLRIQALHLDETLSTRPFDDFLRPDPRAFADVNHLMRCRVTGHEVDMDPQLIAILSQLSTLYGRTLQLISGHRAPHANGTSETSQHTLGRAADIRIPGVSIGELKKVAIKLGARGVGLYPEKGFVHIDVREKNRYFWIWTARGGEQPDMGWPVQLRAARHAHAGAAPASDEGGEAGDQGATSPGAEGHDHDAVELVSPSSAVSATGSEGSAQ